MPEHIRRFWVQPHQLAEAMHDAFICPFTHNESHKRYVPRDKCPRLVRLRDECVTLLKDAECRLPVAFSAIFDGTGNWEVTDEGERFAESA